MIVGFKDSAKLIGIILICGCAAFVCTLFLNYNVDIRSIEGLITEGSMQTLYQAQQLMAKFISSISGGCLAITSIVMLFFYIRHYIDAHRKELGILKALGYSRLRIAGSFWVFGLSVLMGTLLGFCFAFLAMDAFYQAMNEDGLLPEFAVHFHLPVFLCLVLVPSLIFALLSCLYGYRKLKGSALSLLRGKMTDSSRPGRVLRSAQRKTGRQAQASKKGHTQKDTPFLQDVRKSTVRGRISITFFIAFASFCYSSMMQMTFSLKDFASEMFAAIIFIICVVLSCTTLLLAITTLVQSNTKTIAMMRVFGYSNKDCCHALLNGYRPIVWAGFGVGTLYKHFLFKLMMGMIFQDVANVPEYTFDTKIFVLVLVSFAVIYELVMYLYSLRIKNISVKEIMLE